MFVLTVLMTILCWLTTLAGGRWWINAHRPPSAVFADQSAAVAPTQAQKEWALATCAILTEVNHGRHELLGGEIPTPERQQIIRETLRRWWGVESREDLLSTMRWVASEGHRAEFTAIEQTLGAMSGAEIQAWKRRLMHEAPKQIYRVEMVQRYAPELKGPGILAWDLDRFVALCGWGYIAGYLTEAEAYSYMMPAAITLQSSYGSWEELGRSHIIGRQFWSQEQTQATGFRNMQAYQTLISSPRSPWARIPWTLDLHARPSP